MVAGELKIVVKSDLGGLGAREAAPVGYIWVPASPIPALLPWCLLAALIAMPKINRHWQAWLVLLPLLAVQVVLAGLPSLPLGWSSTSIEQFTPLIRGLAFGMAVWGLLWPTVPGDRWIATFGKTILALLAGGLPVEILSIPSLGNMPVVGLLLFFGVGVLVVSLALGTAAHLGRRRCRAGRFLACLLAGLILVWGVCFTVVFGIASLFGRIPPLGEIIVVCLAFMGVTFAVLLPFNLLYLTSGFYRARLIIASPPADAAATP